MLNSAELVSILRQAQEAGITPPPLDHSTLPPYAIKQMSKFVLTDRGLEERLTNFLNEQADLKLFQGTNKMMNYGGGSATSVGVGSLAQSLLFKTRQDGPEIAVRDLEKFLATPATPGYEILAISGIVVDTAIDLGNQIALIPIKDLPPSDARDLFVDALRATASASPIPLQNDWNRPKAALLSHVNFAPKTFEHSTEQPHSPPGLQRYFDLEEACLLLTLVQLSSPISVAHWTQVEDWVPCARSEIVLNLVEI